MLFNSAIERLYDFNVGIIVMAGERIERPHKPMPLLATPGRVPCCRKIRDRFTVRVLLIKTHNDHPTYGLALCKNHHWAMDRNRIAPCPDYLPWQSLSRRREASRRRIITGTSPKSSIRDSSNEEKELLERSGKSLLLPQR